MKNIALFILLFWLNILVIIASGEFFLGDSRLGYPSYCICLRDENHGQSSSVLFQRDTLDTATSGTAYRLYSVISNVTSSLGFCVADSLSLEAFPSLRSMDVQKVNVTSIQSMMKAMAESQFRSLTFPKVCISYLSVFNVTVRVG